MCIDTCQIWIDMSSKGEHDILLVVDHHHKVVIDKEPDEENRMNRHFFIDWKTELSSQTFQLCFFWALFHAKGLNSL